MSKPFELVVPQMNPNDEARRARSLARRLGNARGRRPTGRDAGDD